MTVFIASIIRESSPPEAIFDSGRKSCPGFVDIINLTKSYPLEVILLLFSKSILNLTSRKLRFFKDSMNSVVSLSAAFFLATLNISAVCSAFL